MVLFGTKGGMKERGRGTFLCPRCKSDQTYVHIELVRMGHLYFVPLVELGSVGEYVECQNCDGQFDVAVLTFPTRAGLEANLNLAIRGAFAVMIRSDAVVDDQETTAGRHIVKRLTGDELITLNQQTDLRSADLISTMEALTSLSNHLSEVGKVEILEACAIVAVADGSIDDVEFKILTRFAQALGVPTQYLPGIVEPVLRRSLMWNIGVALSRLVAMSSKSTDESSTPRFRVLTSTGQRVRGFASRYVERWSR